MVPAPRAVQHRYRGWATAPHDSVQQPEFEAAKTNRTRYRTVLHFRGQVLEARGGAGTFNGGVTNISPLPNISQLIFTSGQRFITFMTKSRLGLLRPDRICDMPLGCMPISSANWRAVMFFAFNNKLIRSIIML